MPPLAAGNKTKEPLGCPDCNVVLVSLTNVRADHLGLYGYPRPTSPNLDALAGKAIVFENAFATASWTLPSIFSVYTSMYPFRHNVMTRYQFTETGVAPMRLDTNVITLVDILNNQGYTSVSINGARDFQPYHGLTSRFDENVSLQSDSSGGNSWGIYGTIDDIAPKAIQWIKAHQQQKFFLHLQAYDAHCPFAYPKENDQFDPEYAGDVDFTRCYWTFDRVHPVFLKRDGERRKVYSVKSSGNRQETDEDLEYLLDERDIEHMVALYDGEIYNSDRRLAGVFKTLNDLQLMEKTIVVVFSEHGDMFGKHGRFMRGGPLRGTFYDDVLHVPLLIYHPRMNPKRIKSLVSLIDLAPTLLDFLGISAPAAFQGESLVQVIDEDSQKRRIFAGALFTPQTDRRHALFKHSTLITAVRDGQTKLIRETVIDPEDTQTSYELFDIRTDPQELHNTAEQQFQKLETYNAFLNDWIASEGGLSRLTESARRMVHEP